MAKISKNIKKLRTQKQLTQDALAEKIWVTRQTVSSWENDRTQPDIDMLVSLADALEVSIEELIYGEKRNIGLEADKYRSTLSVIFAVLGSLLIGAGLVMVFVTGWENFPLALKTVFGFAPMLAGQCFALFTMLRKKDSLPFREGAAVFWCAGVIATVALINSIYGLKSGYITCLSMDGALCLPVMYLLGAVTPLAFCSYSVIHWGIEMLHSRGDNKLEAVLIPVASVILLALVLMFVPIMKKRLDEVRLGYGVWIACISGTVLITLITAFSSLNFLPALLACGMLLFSLEENGEFFRVFQALGLLLVIIPTLLISFGINAGSAYTRAVSAEEITAICLSGVVIVATVFVNIKRKGFTGNPAKPAMLLCSLVSVLCAFSEEIVLKSDEAPGNIISTVFFIFLPLVSALIMGVCLLVTGAKKMSFLYINLGFGVTAAVVYALLFRGDLNLLQNGLIFIALGCSLLLMNFKMAKKKKALTAKTVPADGTDAKEVP